MPELPPVRHAVVVRAPVDRAFAVFTQDMASWWPPEHHLLAGELAAMVFEPWVGGRIYDRAVDGAECQWARVLAYEPPHRVVFSWDVSPTWQIETDHDRTSEVEVRFSSEPDGRTKVELEHRNLERVGDGGEQVRQAVDEGWPVGLGRFQQRMEASP
jgi:uncharacterized protein YndB with AHSA1/START domain